MADLILNFEQTEKSSRVRRIVRLSLPGLPDDYSREGVYFEFDGDRAPEPLVLDGFMFCFLHLAMERADRFVIRGPISAKALRNAQIYQEAWHCWLPARYRVIEIAPENAISEWRFGDRRRGRAISAFSGGVDASFLALRHSQGHPSFYDLKSVLTVHGFDVDIDNADGFERLIDRTEPLLRKLNLERRILSTNIRRNEIQEWEHSFGAQIACALHQYSHDYSYGLLGSSEPYSNMVNAWGSTPSTDYLLSGDDLEIVHEGAGFSRTQKVELVAQHPVAREVVKVCWAGREQFKNCGQCEKCVRTRLNFAAVGDLNPPCFETPFSAEAIDTINVGSIAALTELETILEYVRERSVEHPWADRLRKRVSSLAVRFR